MSNAPDALKADYFFDMSLMEYTEVFAGANFIWDAVKTMQDEKKIDEITRAKCAGVAAGGSSSAAVMGKVEVKIGANVVISPNVVFAGDGGVIAIDEGAHIRPGTMMVAGKNAVYVGKGATVGPNAHVDAAKGSVSVGAKATLRQGAYLRELCLIASKATIGNSCEIKCALIGPEAEVPHFNYVGDSILGYKAHMGAGVKISNLKITPDPKKVNSVKVRYDNVNYDTGMRKFGVILGDKAQLGCNTVTNPGTFVGKNTLVYSNSSVVGFIAANKIVKLRQNLEESELKLS